MQYLSSFAVLIGVPILAIYILSQLGSITSFALKILAVPPTMIARMIVIIMVLPAAFSMANAERTFASIDPQGAQAPTQAQDLMKKMSKDAATSWVYGQADEHGMRIAFRIARTIVRA